MALFSALQTTQKGLQLLAKGIAGTEIQFTKIQLGDGVLQVCQSEVKYMTALVSVKMTLEITGLSVLNEIATVYASYNNSGVESGFTWRELGLFAMDPDEGEILYSYANAGDNGDYIPPGGTGIVERQIAVRNKVSTASNISASLAESLIYVTEQQMTAAVNAVPYYTAEFTKVGNVWVFTSTKIPAETKEFAIQANVNANSVDNQKIKINSRSEIPLKLGTSNVMANDVDVSGGNVEVTIKVNMNTGVMAAFLENGGGSGGGGIVISDTAPTTAADKKKQWFCSDASSTRYHTLNIWDGTAWVPVTGTFSA